MGMKYFYLFVLSTLCSFKLCFSAHHIHAITPSQPITDDVNTSTTLVSAGETFELGFFSPGNSKSRFIGIWYKITPNVVVWIANRNDPLRGSNGSKFTIDDKGNLVLLDGSKSVVWSSNSSNVANNPAARLLESGNLVVTAEKLGSDLSELYSWQSFDYPTDTLLPGMKIGWDLKTSSERHLTSWKSANDPSSGDSVIRVSLDGLPQIVVQTGSTRKYRSGTWNGVRFSGINLFPETVFRNIYLFNDDKAYFSFETTVNSTILRLKIDHSGSGQQFTLQTGSTKWSLMFTLPYGGLCENYGYCGPNTICLINGYPACQCLKGFMPTSQEEWTALSWSNGCERKISSRCHDGEGFAKVVGVKLPDMFRFHLNKNIMRLEECEEACLKNCSCVAYANSDLRNGGSGCLMWFGDLIDIKEIHEKDSEQDIYLRLSSSELKSIRDANKRRKLKIILAVSLTLGITCVFGVAFWCITWKLRRRVKGTKKDEDIDLPLFDLATINNATNNFSAENMIGEGGFGPVYKGRLSAGQEIAVKRLSKNSGQGLKEFKNEVELIAKLQHKNLVALLGCCIQREEQILVYEYMPNKSLDNFIFDRVTRTRLPWKNYFSIVRGIARGLLYLHQDSKLQIIHRDLKASNVLLDENLNPKISDFGLARIFQDDEKEAKTKRVVGTYGYMPPEYAIDGKFSVKSDVFSFGVVLLETVSGKKNRCFNHHEHYHNLLGHAWLLWNENKALDLMDVCLNDTFVESEVSRCVQVGLLCVQKFPQDRPTMSSVVFMLENEAASLPQPKEPGFFVERNSSSEECSTSRTDDGRSNSENAVTITMISGRN